MAWEVEFFKEPDGSAPVAEFLRSLPAKQRVKLIRSLELLKEHGTSLGYPDTSQVRGKIRELRTSQGGTNLRVLYAPISGKIFVLLVGFTKDTKKVPDSEISLAEKRLADWRRRR